MNINIFFVGMPFAMSFITKLFHLLAVAVIMASILTLSKNIGRDTLNICIKNVLKVRIEAIITATANKWNNFLTKTQKL